MVAEATESAKVTGHFVAKDMAVFNGQQCTGSEAVEALQALSRASVKAITAATRGVRAKKGSMTVDAASALLLKHYVPQPLPTLSINVSLFIFTSAFFRAILSSFTTSHFLYSFSYV